MKINKQIISSFFCATTLLSVIYCSSFSSSCSTNNLVNVTLHNQNSPITINKKQAKQHTDFYCFLSTIASNEIEISQITVNDLPLKKSDYIFDSTNGSLFIPNNFINGDIIIDASSKNRIYSLNLSSDSIDNIDFYAEAVIKNKTLDIQIENPTRKNIYVDYVLVNNKRISNHNFYFSPDTEILTILGKFINGDITFCVKEKNTNSYIIQHKINDELTIAGGSETMTSKYQTDGKDSKSWKVTFKGVDVTQQASLKIEGPDYDNISIDKTGLVRWNYLLDEGHHYFKIFAWYQDPQDHKTYEVYSPQIKLTIVKNLTWEKGSENLNGIYHLGGFDDNCWKLYCGGFDVTNNSILTLKNAPKGIAISKDGRLSWDNSLVIGKYEIQIDCEYIYLGQKVSFFGSTTLSISAQQNLCYGSTILEGKSSESGSDYKFWGLFICNGFVMPQFELIGDNLDNIKIDENGLIFWITNIKPNTYHFQVKATTIFAGINFELKSEQITLNIR